MGSTWLARPGSAIQSAMKAARSDSLMGLHDASRPSPNMTYGFPPVTSFTYTAFGSYQLLPSSFLPTSSSAGPFAFCWNSTWDDIPWMCCKSSNLAWSHRSNAASPGTMQAAYARRIQHSRSVCSSSWPDKHPADL